MSPGPHPEPHAGSDPDAGLGRLSRIGLTGGIGSGKSTVAAVLAEAGAAIVDTDAIARALTAPGGAALPRLAQVFGARILDADGALDRAHMRELAFSDPTARQRLEQVLHPLIGEEAQAQAHAAGTRPVVFDVPLLAESGHWRTRVQRVLVVDCEEATQVQRVMARSGWDREVVLRVIAQQSTRTRRRAIADAVIFNEGLTREALRAQVQALWAHWQHRPH
ncbi:MAG: dephospho-CoA kinase [Pseudomonadota bacterium]|jgi:dephospho-CoA kinase